MFHSLSTSWAGLLVGATLASAVAIPQDLAASNDTVSIESLSTSAQTYDYIIVGGGLTGLVAANRLSEDRKASVLVLEFGPFDRSNLTLWPANAAALNLRSMFNITSAPEPYLGEGRYAVRAGSVPGGGSTVNGMQLDRASAADYDSFGQLENSGWTWKNLLTYFKKSTHFNVPNPEIAKKYKYTWDTSAYGNGPLQAAFPEFQYPDTYPFFDGFKELGIPFIREHAAGNAVGVYWTPASINPNAGYTRSSSLTAYYDPVSSRSNLKLLIEHQVFEIIFEGKDLTATGVKALDRKTNREVTFKAKKEVILAAGAIHTPQILQLSGIGPGSVLSAAGIKTKLNFPAVGSNFQDHPTAYLNWNLTNSFPYPGILQANATYNAEALALYLNKQTGPYTKAQANSVGFLSLKQLGEKAAAESIAALEKQNSATYLPPAYADKELLAGFNAQKKILIDQFKKGTVANVEIPFSGSTPPNSLQKPLSRGTVYLNATNPRGEPVVTHYAFQNPFDKDVLFASVEWTRQLFESDSLGPLKPVEITPGAQYQTRDAVFEALRVGRSPFGTNALVPTFAHPSCSCPMMPKKLGGVVGADLLVYGTKKLSIIDGSILPIIPAAHLQASLYATAEKAADVIKGRQ